MNPRKAASSGNGLSIGERLWRRAAAESTKGLFSQRDSVLRNAAK
jgi:hypothetical protein